jgi:hypothetical protein
MVKGSRVGGAQGVGFLEAAVRGSNGARRLRRRLVVVKGG